VFRIDQENRQVEVFCQTARNFLLPGSGEVRSQGIDFELQGALTDNWQVGGGYTYARVHTIKDQPTRRTSTNRSTPTPRSTSSSCTPRTASRARWKNCAWVATSGRAACTTTSPWPMAAPTA
jgi:outer membrane receptor for ferric coprogen and ferric-rhodotorulic acid